MREEHLVQSPLDRFSFRLRAEEGPRGVQFLLIDAHVLPACSFGFARHGRSRSDVQITPMMLYTTGMAGFAGIISRRGATEWPVGAPTFARPAPRPDLGACTRACS